jgi:tetratricopeptide (TPR) repeat protein
MEKPKPNNAKSSVAKSPANEKAAAVAKPLPIKVPPLFRKIDWLVMGITFAVIWAVYLLTLAPELTLEDSGELCTGSFYAGIPHPPGYPFWAIYSWFWTVIVPFGNVAWRVEVGESFAAAAGCGIIAFMVSRGSSMLIEGIEELKTLSGQWEKAICMVSGFVAGTLIGFDVFMWSESVVINRISVFGVPWLLLVLLMLMRWIYAPHQKRYLYLAMFFYGLCATIHQTLLLSAMGIEVAIAAALPRLGRDLFLGNSLIYLVVLLLRNSQAIAGLNNMSSIEVELLHLVGIGSFAAWNWLYLKAIIEKKQLDNSWLKFLAWPTLGLIGLTVLFFLLLLIFQPAPNANPESIRAVAFGQILDKGLKIFQLAFCAYGIVLGVCSLASIWKGIETRDFGRELLIVIVMGLTWLLGICFYFYEPLAGMTCPPMQWGYPRTVEGFFHALSRGQYETAVGTNILQDPSRFVFQLGYIVQGLAESFNWVYMFIGLLPFLFILKMHKRERSWIIGLTSIYFCISVLLVILLNVSSDRSSSDLNKVFFTASHALFAIMIGYGLTLMAAYMAVHYDRFRNWGFVGSGVAVLVAFLCLWEATGRLYFGPGGGVNLSDLPHWIAQAFGKNQYGLPVFANLILVAMPIVFICALLAYRQRGPVLILLGLFAIMPIHSGLTHWYKSEQRNHWFGYWFGHDMFTPPFGIYPEMTRNSILFGGTDPGRFCPTYMIFCESFIPHNTQPYLDQKFDRRDVYIITQNALADGTYLDYIRSQYFRSAEKDPPFFREFVTYVLGIPFGENSSFVHSLAQMSFSLLDVPFTKLGKSIEDRRRKEGVYPPVEIYTPSPDDSQNCFRDYTDDVARRQQLGQLKQGEDVHVDPVSGRVQVSGQVAVMEINGLLCRVIFDHNPTNDFYVEESFPLDWMYPYETPSGIIMKINREPLTTLPDDVYKKDHEFWSKYSERLIGNWINYDTSVQQIADFVEKVYLHNNFEGFTGDRKFVRDDDGQKAFSKLRSSIAGVYAWRSNPQCPPEYRPKTQAEMNSLLRETDFAFKQSFAFCPYSPEAVYRYVNFLLQFGRLDDALIIAQTCLKLDPYNDQIIDLIKRLEDFKEQSGQRSQLESQIQQMEAEAQKNPTNFQNVIGLGRIYFQTHQTNRATELLNRSLTLFDQALANPNLRMEDAAAMAQICAQSGNLTKLETVIQKITSLQPTQPEPRYDLAALDAVLGKSPEALQSLRTALDLSAKRLATNPTASNLLLLARTDPRLNSLRNLPEFQALVPPN